MAIIYLPHYGAAHIWCSIATIGYQQVMPAAETAQQIPESKTAVRVENLPQTFIEA
jgi:hypothetical protein